MDVETAIFAAELGDCPSLDLHGLPVENALHELDIFIDRHFVAGVEAVKVIHGRGTDRLRQAVWNWLKQSGERVAGFRGTQRADEQGAVTYVALHRV
jgi:DNA mismatch repair protein MutS2